MLKGALLSTLFRSIGVTRRKKNKVKLSRGVEAASGVSMFM